MWVPGPVVGPGILFFLLDLYQRNSIMPDFRFPKRGVGMAIVRSQADFIFAVPAKILVLLRYAILKAIDFLVHDFKGGVFILIKTQGIRCG